MDIWDDRVARLALSIDSSIELNDIGGLNDFCDEIKELLEDGAVPESVKSALVYYLSNIYTHFGVLEKNAWNNSSYGQAIICHRKFYRYSDLVVELLPMVEVNHGNLLSSICRVFEAIPLWKKGIAHDGDPYEVGLYRLSESLIWLSNHLYDDNHVFYYQLYAYKYLKILKNKSTINHDGIARIIGKDSGSLVSRFLNYVGDHLDDEPELSESSFTPDYKGEERKYRSWCKENVLFINPLNDLSRSWVVAHDVMSFPSYKVPIMEGPYFSASFSSMKNEFCYFRHLFYEGVNKKYCKFIDRDKYLVDTGDGVVYEGYVEKIKMAIKGCFSVLEKVSRLIDRYYGLNSKNVAFSRSWFDKQKVIREMENPFLIALFWLSKDFSSHEDDERRPSYWLNDSAFEVRELRNELEHGWVRVVDPSLEGWMSWEDNQDYAYIITIDELIEKGLYVLRQTRSSLMYLCLAINFSEKLKNESATNVISMAVPTV